MKCPPREVAFGRLLQARVHLGSIRKASAAVGIPYTTASRWLKRADQAHAPKKPRKGTLTAVQRHAAFDMLSQASASGVADQLFKEGIVERVLHKSTVIRAAQSHASLMGTSLKYALGPPQKELSPATKQKRLAFAKENAKRNWSLVLFTDRKKFALKYPGVKVGQGKWLKGSEKNEVATVNHAYTVNIYAGLSPYGLTLAHEVAGTKGLKTPFFNKKGQQAKNITAAEYENVMKTTLLPGGRRLFTQGRGIASWVFQQDNDPSHKLAPAHVKSWNGKQKASVKLLGSWPPNSPDLNPIENVWAWMDAKINSLGCKTYEEFRVAVSKTCQKVPLGMIKKLYASMPRRIELVMKNSGGKTGY